MVISKSPRDIELMKEAGRVVSLVFKNIKEKIRPGMSTLDIDEIVEKTNINPARCILILTTLQISGYVESNMPSYYKIAPDSYYK